LHLLAGPITPPPSPVQRSQKSDQRKSKKSFPLRKIALGKWLAMYKNVKDRIVRINDRDRGEREWCTENKGDQFEKFEVL